MPILTQTLPPLPGGINVALAPQEIDDTEGQYLQDALLDYAGLCRTRGPVAPYSGVSALTRPATGLVATVDPAGNSRFGALNGTSGAGFFSIWNSALSSVVDVTWPFALPTDPVAAAATRYRVFNQSPRLAGGSYIGTSSNYGGTAPDQALAAWHGGSSVDYATGTIAFTRGSTGVTGVGTSWLSTASPGMFLFAGTDDAGAGTFTLTFIGHVQTVNSNTSITLSAISPYSGSAGRAYNLTSLRGFIPKVNKGRVTSDTSSTTVSGGATKFSSQGLGTGTWNLYRSRDLTWIGKVASVQSDISLTLAANASIASADENYVAIRGDWSVAEKSVDLNSSNKVGFLTALYAERQWYANNGIDFVKSYRLHFSGTGDREAVDLTDDGDWIPISSTTDSPEPIRALAPTYNALVVMKDTETFAVYGSSPTSFSAKKLENDGVLSTMAVQSYGGGCIWPGRNGIYYYDGVSVNNLTQGKFGNVWKNTVRTFDPLRYRAWSTMVRNHYFLFFESLAPTIGVVKGTVTTTPTHWTVCLNMDTGAFTLWSNVGIRGSVDLPAEQGRGVWVIVNDVTAGVGKIADTADWFDQEALDTLVTTPGGTLGPDWYVHTKKFNAGDDVRLKRFKQFAVHYMSQTAGIKIDTVLGLNNVGSTLGTVLPPSVLTWDSLRVLIPTWDGVVTQYPSWNNLIQGVFQPKRARFLKKAHHMSFRLYRQNNTGIRAKIGPFQIGYKLMRTGRV